MHHNGSVTSCDFVRCASPSARCGRFRLHDSLHSSLSRERALETCSPQSYQTAGSSDASSAASSARRPSQSARTLSAAPKRTARSSRRLASRHWRASTRSPGSLAHAPSVLWDARQHGDRRTELVCIGRELDHEAARAQLEGCLLTTEEMAAGQEGWLALADPFAPRWEER